MRVGKILSEKEAIILIKEIFKDNNCKPLNLKEIYENERLFNIKNKYKSNKDFEGAIRKKIQLNSKNSKTWNRKNDIFQNKEIGKGTWELKDKSICNLNIDRKEIEKIINDIDANMDQDQKWSIVNYKIFNRNKNLVYEVKERANNKCEYCLQETFKNKQDQNYLEAHHINFLSEGGKDQEDNLIALCPNCHRKAHFSKEKREFQQDLRNIVDKYKSKNPYISLPNNL